MRALATEGRDQKIMRGQLDNKKQKEIRVHRVSKEIQVGWVHKDLKVIVALYPYWQNLSCRWGTRKLKHHTLEYLQWPHVVIATQSYREDLLLPQELT
jgi:hypothetical protein